MSKTPEPVRSGRYRGWLPALGAGGVLLVSALFVPGSLPGASVCWFKTLCGLPCPGCGLTRAFCSISHGHFAEAWRFNPFSYLFYALAVLLVFYPLLARRWPEATERLVRHRLLGWSAVALALVMWAFAIWRIRSGYGPA